MAYFTLPTTLEGLAALFTVLLCGLVGVERQLRHKPAGIRTHVLVGLGSCLFTMVSFYGAPRLGASVDWDASRIAAQIVSGVGFLGAGLIFVQRDAVRGLTTAGAVWICAAIGMACGAGMFTVSIMVTAVYFIVILGVAPLITHLLTSFGDELLEIVYEDGRGVLRDILLVADRHGYRARIRSTRTMDHDVRLSMLVSGGRDHERLISDLSDLDGVHRVQRAAEPE